DGLGVYYTDAPPPRDEAGREEDWVMGPGYVHEVPPGTHIARVKGVGSVSPSLDHIKYLTDTLYEGSATFRSGQVDVAMAQSGVALAMKFLPTLAKLEQRDWSGLALLRVMFYNWKFWIKAYEGLDFTEQDIAVTIGEKLPTNRTDKLNE